MIDGRVIDQLTIKLRDADDPSAPAEAIIFYFDITDCWGGGW